MPDEGLGGGGWSEVAPVDGQYPAHDAGDGGENWTDGAYDEADGLDDGDLDLTGDGGGDDLSLPAAGDDLGDASASRLDSLSKRDVQRMSDEEILQFAKGADAGTLRKSLLLQAGFTQRMQKLSELERDLKGQQTQLLQTMAQLQSSRGGDTASKPSAPDYQSMYDDLGNFNPRPEQLTQLIDARARELYGPLAQRLDAMTTDQVTREVSQAFSDLQRKYPHSKQVEGELVDWMRTNRVRDPEVAYLTLYRAQAARQLMRQQQLAAKRRQQRGALPPSLPPARGVRAEVNRPKPGDEGFDEAMTDKVASMLGLPRR
jgi:hypothetical protein